MPKRKTTSAIPGHTISEVRKGLAEIRSMWKDSSPCDPMYGCERLKTFKENPTVLEFALRVILGHHDKRHNKVRSAAAAYDSDSGSDDAGSGTDDDDDDGTALRNSCDM